MHTRHATTSGFILKLARTSAGHTQEELAEQLSVTKATIQSWESGRRPLSALAVAQSIALSDDLLRVGASPGLVNLLSPAAQADFYLSAVLQTASGDRPAQDHPLGRLVLTHTLTELLTWPLTGTVPQTVQIATPPTMPDSLASGPALAAEERSDFFRGLARVSEANRRRSTSASILAQRQAWYLSSVDPSGQATAALHRSTVPDPTSGDDWTLSWAATRSAVVAMARHGDPDPLLSFVKAGADSNRVGLAHLNYHAYWVGETPERQVADAFMIDTSMTWHGGRLLKHLADRLPRDHRFTDLNVHVLWLLLTARPTLGQQDSATARRLVRESEILLDSEPLSTTCRKELSEIRYSLRAMGFQP